MTPSTSRRSDNVIERITLKCASIRPVECNWIVAPGEAKHDLMFEYYSPSWELNEILFRAAHLVSNGILALNETENDLESSEFSCF